MQNDEIVMIQKLVHSALVDLYQNNFGMAVHKLEDLNKSLLKNITNPKADE